MKITHPFVVLIAGGVLVIGTAWMVTKPRPLATVEPTTAPEQPAATHTPLAPPAEVPTPTEVVPVAAEPPTTEDPDAAIKAIITKRLKDPESARFQKIRHASNTEVCGEVNSKNSFGGYVGFSAFWINDITITDPVVIVDTSDASIAAALCKDR
jgi:hypothetical protein